MNNIEIGANSQTIEKGTAVAVVGDDLNRSMHGSGYMNSSSSIILPNNINMISNINIITANDSSNIINANNINKVKNKKKEQ